MNLAKKLQTFGISDEKKQEVMKIKSIYDFMQGGDLQQFVFGVLQSLFDDLQMPQVLASVCACVKSLDEDLVAFLYRFDQKVLGLKLFDVEIEDKNVSHDSVPVEVLALAMDRVKARKNKDWSKADELRDKIASLGYGVEDKGGDFEIVKL